MPNVVIADDEDFVRHYLKTLLDTIFFETVAEVSNGDKILDAVKAQKTDLLLLDINMPGLKGDNFILRYKQELKATCVIILTISTSEEIKNKLEKAGFKYFLRKDTPPEKIVECIQKDFKEFCQLNRRFYKN